eukprot:scaffold9336_cov133-Isochrysis_galbana.AAC.12
MPACSMASALRQTAREQATNYPPQTGHEARTGCAAWNTCPVFIQHLSIALRFANAHKSSVDSVATAPVRAFSLARALPGNAQH